LGKGVLKHGYDFDGSVKNSVNNMAEVKPLKLYREYPAKCTVEKSFEKMMYRDTIL